MPGHRKRATSLGVASAIVLLGGLQMSPSNAQTEATKADPEAIVDALKLNAGNPPKTRGSFARGQCVRGTYTPAPQVAQITRSLSFARPSRVLARFSVGGGNPHVADTNKTVLRGFSVRLDADGTNVSDILFENAPVHFAKTMDQMLAFLRARAPGADGKPDAMKIKTFSDANPETLNQANFIAAKPLPGSFAGIVYWGVHAFPATNPKGETRFIKFKVVPVDGEVTLTDDEAKTKAPDFLTADLEKRIADHRVRFDVLALLDRPGDPTLDLTVRWPDEDNRQSVKLGTIAITALEKNETCDGITFNPGTLADGIAYPPDEMFAGRVAGYPFSFAKRQE